MVKTTITYTYPSDDDVNSPAIFMKYALYTNS